MQEATRALTAGRQRSRRRDHRNEARSGSVMSFGPNGPGSLALAQGWLTSRRVRLMTSPLTMTAYRPAGRLGSYVRAFQVFSATQPARVSVLDFGGGDVSVPVCTRRSGRRSG